MGLSKVWGPRQKFLLSGCMDSAGSKSIWVLVFSRGAPSAETLRGSFLETLGGAGFGRNGR